MQGREGGLTAPHHFAVAVYQELGEARGTTGRAERGRAGQGYGLGRVMVQAGQGRTAQAGLRFSRAPATTLSEGRGRKGRGQAAEYTVPEPRCP